MAQTSALASPWAVAGEDPPPVPNYGLADAISFAARDLHSAAIFGLTLHCLARPLVLDDRPALIVAPHQDDETFGCGGLISLKRRMGAPVTVVFLTNGAGSHWFAPGVNGARLMRTRRAEARRALGELGVAADHVHELPCPDGKLDALPPADAEALVARLAELMGDAGCEQVFVTHAHDAHRDHEAAFHYAQRAVRTARRQPQLYQYSIWMSWLSPLFTTLKPRYLAGARWLGTAPVLAAKRRAMRAYASQNAILPPGFVRRFGWPYELYFQAEGP